MSCKPGVASSIPGFSIKPLSVEPSGVPVIKNTQIINPRGPVLVTTHGKATKSFFYIFQADSMSDCNLSAIISDGNSYQDIRVLHSCYNLKKKYHVQIQNFHQVVMTMLYLFFLFFLLYNQQHILQTAVLTSFAEQLDQIAFWEGGGGGDILVFTITWVCRQCLDEQPYQSIYCSFMQ